MNFTEAPFVWFFLATYGLWMLCRRRYTATVFVLLAANLVFYGYHRPELVAILVSCCVVDWSVGLWIGRARRPAPILAMGIGFNLAILGYWKYSPLLLRTFADTAGALGVPGPASPSQEWLIPIGISFYSFTGIAYLVDVHRRAIPAESNVWRFMLFLTFFPHLVAGPILRASEFLVCLQPHSLPRLPEAPLEANLLIARGFFKKMVLADRIALAIDPFFAHVADASTAGVWSLPFVYLYAFQIYFDFSGYTDIARGLGLLFGFRWPENFNAPYLAGSIREFWSRWHMTLSRFLRDYLYIPLGGSRHGRWRTRAALLVTMLLGGLWHGASWNFLLWGGLHGSYLLVHRRWTASGVRDRMLVLTGPRAFLWRAACVILTFHCVTLAWCFFRLRELDASLACVRKWFVFDPGMMLIGGSAGWSIWLLVALYGFGAEVIRRAGKAAFPQGLAGGSELDWARGFAWTLGTVLLVLAVVMSPASGAPPFIYFQF